MVKGIHGGIEGTDGAGKKTQVRKFLQLAESEGFKFVPMAFPRYDTPAGRVVKDYLFGEFGPATKLPPRLSGAPYSIDRLVASPEIESYLAQGINVIDDRFIGSNLAHQAAKLPTLDERREYVEWCINYEHVKLGIPRQDLVTCLYLPRDVAMNSVVQRGDAKDDHEKDMEYQKEVVDTYLWLAKTLPNWRLIDCMHIDGTRKTEDEVVADVWKEFRPLLAERFGR